MPAILPSPFPQRDLTSGNGRQPFVFDVLGPDRETSLLTPGCKLVLEAGPSEVSFSWTKKVEATQTKGGWAEHHWTDEPLSMTFQAATGGFKRLYAGVTGATSPSAPNRRETLAYDSYLDFLALFLNNGAIFDTNGQIAYQGCIKVTFEEGTYLGFFQSFDVQESKDNPFRLTISATFTVDKVLFRWRSL